MCSTPPSFHHTEKPQHTDLTSPDHHLTLSMVKKNMKWSALSITDVMVGLDDSNISSNGKGTPKVTTHGNQLTRCTLRNSSNFIIDTLL